MRPGVAFAYAAALLALVAVCLPADADAQPRFGVEVEGTRNVGLTPYLRNVVYSDAELQGQDYAGAERFRPFLADERSGWGSGVALRIVSNAIHGGLTFQWFKVDTARVHHRGSTAGTGDDTLRPTRIRADETVDDSGVRYSELDEPVEIPVGPAKEANLFVFGLEGGYRFYLYQGNFDIFTPVTGSLLLVHLGRRGAPYRPGLGLSTGVSASFDFVSVMSLVVGARIEGFGTPEYWHRSDAARRAAELGETTEAALFSTQLSASLQLAVQFGIR